MSIDLDADVAPTVHAVRAVADACVRTYPTGEPHARPTGYAERAGRTGSSHGTAALEARKPDWPAGALAAPRFGVRARRVGEAPQPRGRRLLAVLRPPRRHLALRLVPLAPQRRQRPRNLDATRELLHFQITERLAVARLANTLATIEAILDQRQSRAHGEALLHRPRRKPAELTGDRPPNDRHPHTTTACRPARLTRPFIVLSYRVPTS